MFSANLPSVSDDGVIFSFRRNLQENIIPRRGIYFLRKSPRFKFRRPVNCLNKSQLAVKFFRFVIERNSVKNLRNFRNGNTGKESYDCEEQNHLESCKPFLHFYADCHEEEFLLYFHRDPSFKINVALIEELFVTFKFPPVVMPIEKPAEEISKASKLMSASEIS